MLKKNTKLRQILGFLLIILMFLIILNRNISFTYAQTNGEPIPISTNLGFFEYSEIEGIKENISSIDIQLPELNWTITNIQINFSDISLGSEIKTIESTETGLEQVWNKNIQFRTFALGMQIEILELTELFGVYIKGYKTPEATEIIKFQIQGFDEGNYSPNNIIYRSIDLNISTSLDWYYQDFSSDPIKLPIGNYSLVMNGTNLLTDDQVKYYWQKDNLDPQIPNLYTSSYITSWSTGIVNTSFLCKLHQKVDETYFPTDLNMTAEFNGNNYKIMNGPISGTGSLDIANITHFSEETNLNLPLKINKTITLIFNCNYSINLTHEFSTKSSVIIEESHNKWSLSPIIVRISKNYFIRFNIPKNWFNNISVYRKLSSTWENVTSMLNIDMNNRFINIPNNTIEDGSEWRIVAYSPNFNFYLNFPVTEWEPGQELQFSVRSPIVDGNLTFDLINPLGFGFEDPIVKEKISEETFFTYLIPPNAIEGTYIAKIYWNNATDAGVQSQIFEIAVPPIPFTVPPFLLVMIILILIGVAAVGILSYRTLNKFRIRKIEETQKTYSKCMDALNLEYLMVTDKKSGLNLYEQNLAGRAIDGTLISGFLQAIHSFGIELIKVEDKSQTIKLEYKDSIILMSEFVNLRLILIMKESPSRFLLYSIEELVYEIYKQYGKLIDDFRGDIKPFEGIEELLKQHLNVSFIYPLKLAKIENLEKIRINQNELFLINAAKTIMKKNREDHFYIKSIFTEKTCNPKDIENVLSLIDKKIFQPI